ncbi:uncharacterized protein LOC126910566 [Daktulosphaira vitifoliae]|uniref:uncharacterized protein LOC126910566 n=1 Tax=Daktulosphaira vitifoliae TaxID=58002 RepID=UPI0021AAEE0C|nr:uncharacterized protein LOC126910566 [Daktulosphaira vitifoliae]
MAKIGNIEEYKIQDDFVSWVERLELFMQVNKIKENKESILLTLIGSEGYKILKSLCTPTLPKDVSYDKLVSNMINYLQPKVSVVAERSKFRNSLQSSNESITEFVTKLQKLSMLCDFGNNLEESLRDQIVHGVKDRTLKKRLCEEADLTYEKGKEICQAHEGAEKILENFGQSSNECQGEIYFANKKFTRTAQNRSGKITVNGGNVTCTCCGKKNHVFNNCYFKDRNCNICHKKGHLKSVCYFKDKTDKSRPKSSHYSKVKSKNYGNNYIGTMDRKVSDNEVNESNNFLDNDNLNIDTLFQIEQIGSKNENLFIMVQIENKMVKMQLDTGSAISAISFSEYRNNFKYLPLVDTKINLKSYSGEYIVPVGVIKVKVKFNEKNFSLPLYIIENGGPPLLGNEWIKVLGIKININLEINSITEDFTCNVKELISSFPEVFTDKLGTYKKNDKSPKSQNKGAAKEKVKPIKPAVLKKEGEKVKAEQKSISPINVLQNELWNKAIKVIADKSDLPDKESGIAKLLANYKKQDSIPRKETKLKNFILKGFSQYKDTESEILDSLYNKIKEAFESLSGQPKDGNSETKNSNNKVEKNSPKTKNLKKVEVENSDEDDEDDDRQRR